MTRRIEQAIAALSQLSETEQDTIATLILGKISEREAISSSPISKTDIETLEKFYTLRERAEVLQFIAQYPFLLPVLVEVPDKIHHYFPDSQLSLEVDHDPEIINDLQLVLSILINLDPDEAVDRHNQFDMEWWFDNTSHEVRSQLFTILEYLDEF